MTMPTEPTQSHADQAERRRGWIRRHKILTGVGAAVVLLGIIGAFGGGGGGGTDAATGAAASSSPAAPTGQTAAPAAQAPSSAPAPKPTPTHKTVAAPERIVFTVTGKAPHGVDITYGSDSDNRSGNTGTDAFGMPTGKLPWSRSLKASHKVTYYMISAQLSGSGDITCKLTVGGKTIAKGHASGDYNICSAQASPGLFGGWTSY